MTKLATMGTSSCATIALQGFKEDDYDMNEAHLKDPKGFKEPKNNVSWFYNYVLYPTAQDLGRTDDYPFDALMKQIDTHPKMGNKFLIATLAGYQMIAHDGYWPKKMEEWGFKCIHKTTNSIGGSINHIFVRDPNVVED